MHRSHTWARDAEHGYAHADLLNAKQICWPDLVLPDLDVPFSLCLFFGPWSLAGERRACCSFPDGVAP